MSFLKKLSRKLKVILLVARDYFWLRVVNLQIPKLFYFFYSINLVRYSKDKSYCRPNFSSFYQIKGLKNKSEEILLKSQEQLKDFKLHEGTYKSKKFNKKNFTSALVIVPLGWLDPDSSYGAIHSRFIEFFQEGLVSNNIKVKILEVANADNLLPDLNFYSFIFIWSMSSLDTKTEFFRRLSILENKEKIENTSPLVVGIVTHPLTDEQDVELVLRYKKLVTDLIYFEEKSSQLSSLEKDFNLHHMPYIQKTQDIERINLNFTPSIYISCRIKQNRLSWILVAKYCSLKLNIKHSINVYFDRLVYVGLTESYRPIQVVDNERSQYGFSFSMSHRTPYSDSTLLGSFWDSYKLGVIPLVQMQKFSYISSYMRPYLDYFPIIDESDLFAVIMSSISHPDHFNELRAIIVDRMDREFNSKNVVSGLLESLTQVSV
jgi:hypothetical protein